MNTFGVSVFSQPQEMIALYLGINKQTPKFLAYVQKLLHRTKSPPIAITYTYHFLKDKTEQELSLDVIRFISQLADISQGISMSTSLHGILTQSSFLTELRHSLTHKTMVKGSILLLSKTMIMEELQNKFWKTTIEKLRETYCLSKAKVNQYFRYIYDQDYSADLEWLNLKHNLEYFKACSNYQYKEHISQVINDFKLNIIEASLFTKYYEEVSQQKQIIFIIILMQSYLQTEDLIEHFITFVIRFIKIVNINHFQNKLVLRQCQKSYFLKYMPHAKAFFENLPEIAQQRVRQFWKRKQQMVGKLYTPL